MRRHARRVKGFLRVLLSELKAWHWGFLGVVILLCLLYVTGGRKTLAMTRCQKVAEEAAKQTVIERLETNKFDDLREKKDSPDIGDTSYASAFAACMGNR